MFISMNRFVIHRGQSEQFESRWQERNAFMQGVPGFLRARLLKLDDTHYTAYTEWESEAAFRAWSHSDTGRRCNSLRMPEGVLADIPHLESWQVVQEA